MKVRVVLNDPAYGNERSHNALRPATPVAERGDVELRAFLMGDAA